MSDKLFSYQTIKEPCEGYLVEKNSKFTAFAYPIDSEQDALYILSTLKEIHPKATHHCYALRIGTDGQLYRANDDGEPSGSAGRPILGQIDSFGLTNVFVDVVRYYGGVKLGVPGLIKAYKGVTKIALEQANVITKHIKVSYNIELDYSLVNDFQIYINQREITLINEQYTNTSGIYTLQFELKYQSAYEAELKKKFKLESLAPID